MFEWTPYQQNRICFVMVDLGMNEVPGLGGAGLNMFVSKNGGAFAPSAGTKAEIGNGWYTYLSTVAEANTIGVVAIRVTGAGCRQQNLEYVVKSRVSSGLYFTYTVFNSITGLPEPGVQVKFATDVAGLNVVWLGYTDAFGIARDQQGSLPWLDPGTYYIRLWKVGVMDDVPVPDPVIVS